MRILPVAALTLVLVSPLAHADCKSSYFPLAAGNTWTYTQADGTAGHTSRVAKVEGDKFTFDMTRPAPATPDPKAPKNVTSSFEGACTADGIRVNFQMAGSSASGGHAKMETVSEDGYGFPKDAGVKIGATWSESRVMKMVAQGGKSATTIDMKMTTKTTYKIVAKESITVPAGKFDAFKVVSESETTNEMGGPMAAMMKGAAAAPQKSTQTMWIVKGVGMVKQEMQMAAAPGMPASSASVLASYKVH